MSGSRGDGGYGPDGLGRLGDGGHNGPVDLVDDETIDAILEDEPVDPRVRHLAAFAEEARCLGDGPPPQPSAALAALIDRGGARGDRSLSTARTPPATRQTPAARRRRPGRTLVAARVAGLGLVAKVALAASVGTAGVAAAGATGVLPGPATRQVRQAIEVTTPFEFREPAEDPTPDGAPADDRDRGTVDGPGEGPGAGQPPTAEPGNPRDSERDARAEPERDDPGEQRRKPPEPQQGRSPEQPTPGEGKPGEGDDRGGPGKNQPGRDEAGNGQGQEPKGSEPSEDKAPEKPE